MSGCGFFQEVEELQERNAVTEAFIERVIELSRPLSIEDMEHAYAVLVAGVLAGQIVDGSAGSAVVVRGGFARQVDEFLAYFLDAECIRRGSCGGFSEEAR